MIRAANRRVFSSAEWDRMRAWLMNHAAQIAAVGSAASTRDAMLRDGVLCNLRAVREAAALEEVKFANECDSSVEEPESLFTKAG
jgi:hypothetical protein